MKVALEQGENFQTTTVKEVKMKAEGPETIGATRVLQVITEGIDTSRAQGSRSEAI